MAYLGIDYGHGNTNRDAKTGIRYGVISQHSVTQAWCDSAEPDYGDPHCPKCGNAAVNSGELPEESENWDIAKGACSDWGCLRCEYVFDAQDAFGEEPIGWNYDGDGYKLTDCLDSDIFVLESSFYTFAQFCSPCVPGAGNLDNAMEDGVQTYCLGHDWFEDGKAPYKVFSVETGKEILPA